MFLAHTRSKMVIVGSSMGGWLALLLARRLKEEDPAAFRRVAGLVLIAPAASTVKVTIAPHFDLIGALGGGRLSVADPDSVPAGKYGKTALTALGVWSSVADRLVSAENVRVALAYVARGEAPLGIVYSTDAAAESKVKIVAEFPDNTHQPIVYPAALTKDGKPAAQAFLDYVEGPEASAIFAKAGFVILK